MTEYEMVNLYIQFRNSAAASFMNFVSTLFALLVTTYVAGQKLTRPMVAIVVILFSLFTWVVLIANFDALTNMVNVASEIRQTSANADFNLNWMFTATSILWLDYVPIVTSSAMVVAYLAALVFLWLARNQIAFDRSTQTEDRSEDSPFK